MDKSRRDKLVRYILKHEGLEKKNLKVMLKNTLKKNPRAEYMTQIRKDMNKEIYKNLNESSYDRQT